MKKIIFIICCSLLLVGCGKVNLSNDYTVKITKSNKCNNEPKEYFSDKNQKIYTVCIDKITLKDAKHKIELNKYLKQEDIKIEDTLDNLVSKVIGETSLIDGSTTIYQDGGTIKYTKNGYTIIRCNTSDKNKDIYIGTDNLDFEPNFCGHQK